MPTYVGLQSCIAVMVLADVLRRQNSDVSEAGVLRALRAVGNVEVGGFEVNVSGRRKSGSEFTDIVLIDGEGRVPGKSAWAQFPCGSAQLPAPCPAKLATLPGL